MSGLFRDTLFGHIVRLVTRKRYLQYLEEKDEHAWKQYLNEEKSGHAAHHGTTEPEEKDSDDEKEDYERHGLGGVRTRDNNEAQNNRHESSPDSHASSGTRTEGYNHASGVKVDPEKGKDIHVIEFTGNDPENPQNWSIRKKYFVTFQICLLTTSIYIGSSIYTAGLEDVMMKFHVSQVKATLGLSLFVLGYGLGPMLFSPMSEIPQVGRSPVYLATLFIFILLQLPVALTDNFSQLLAFRFFTGFFGSPVLATGGATIADMYAPRKRAYGLAVWGIAAVCGPVLGPLVGGFAAQAKGWTWTIWELTWASSFAFVFLFFFLPETSSANILYRRTARLRAKTGDKKLTCEAELQATDMSRNELIKMCLVRPFTLNFTEPMVFLLNLYIALIYGLLYIWFESFPLVFIGIYKFSLGKLGLAFLGILIGVFVALGPFFWYLHRYLEPKFNDKGELKPEERLPAACVGAFFVPICLFWFGWSARADIHWIMPIIGSSFFSVAGLLLFNSVLNYLTDAYPDYVASVLAGNDLFRSAFGAGFPLFATAMYKNLGVDWASSTLAFLSIAFIPIPFVLYKYGERLRRMSKHARKDF
ncbi:multidrug resistance protein-like protein [Tothia fuscella]|uniref:Multidrug resistance protein-like protein n=1 Tax=Tothia fuscella TaxID=1048955 RepID=A0A9P4NP60_9PEZI|nr:multidrug resistance protein-like protein [Tothia fuscella]